MKRAVYILLVLAMCLSLPCCGAVKEDAVPGEASEELTESVAPPQNEQTSELTPEDVEEEYSTLQSEIPDATAQEHYDLGTTYYGDMCFDEAEAELYMAYKLEPENPDYVFLLAELYIEKGWDDKAMSLLKEGYEATDDSRLKTRYDQIYSGNFWSNSNRRQRQSYYDYDMSTGKQNETASFYINKYRGADNLPSREELYDSGHHLILSEEIENEKDEKDYTYSKNGLTASFDSSVNKWFACTKKTDRHYDDGKLVLSEVWENTDGVVMYQQSRIGDEERIYTYTSTGRMLTDRYNEYDSHYGQDAIVKCILINYNSSSVFDRKTVTNYKIYKTSSSYSAFAERSELYAWSDADKDFTILETYTEYKVDYINNFPQIIESRQYTLNRDGGFDLAVISKYEIDGFKTKSIKDYDPDGNLIREQNY